jgi:hypothetical protein
LTSPDAPRQETSARPSSPEVVTAAEQTAPQE